jgi:hypothetical protein
MAAPVILVLGNMAVQAGSALIRKQLMKLGFRVAKDYKKFSNVTKVTKDNAANVLNKAEKLSDRLKPSGKVKPKKQELVMPTKPKPKADSKTVGSQFDKSQKLSDFGKVGPRVPKSSRLRNAAAGAASLAPTALGDKSPKQPSYPRTGPTPDAPVRNKPKKDKKGFETQAGTTKPKPPAIEAGFTNVDKAPPKAVLERVIKPKAKPTAVKKELSSFGKAFKKARASKKYDFTFKDKKYTTRYKEETVAEHKKKFGDA